MPSITPRRYSDILSDVRRVEISLKRSGGNVDNIVLTTRQLARLVMDLLETLEAKEKEIQSVTLKRR